MFRHFPELCVIRHPLKCMDLQWLSYWIHWCWWFIVFVLLSADGLFTCKGFQSGPHHTLERSYLDMLGSWQRNKNYNKREQHMRSINPLFAQSWHKLNTSWTSNGTNRHKKPPCKTSTPFAVRTWQTKRGIKSAMGCFEAYQSLTVDKPLVLYLQQLEDMEKCWRRSTWRDKFTDCGP